MATKLNVDDAGLSQEQLDLIEHFEADYNAIDHFLRRALGNEKQTSFSHLVREFSRRHPGWRDGDLLSTVAEIRNAIVHGKTEAYRYVAVPAPAIIDQLRVCRDRLIHPARAIPTFQRKVQTVSVDDSLAAILKIVNQRQYSQFPVYGAQQFRGLLTENGIVRWLAQHVSATLSLVDLEDVRVRDVLRNEEKRKTYHFVPRDCRVDYLSGLFVTYELLEAVLITASGKESEALLGIATPWDVFSAK
jgi:predicted transcriptional regulator